MSTAITSTEAFITGIFRRNVTKQITVLPIDDQKTKLYFVSFFSPIKNKLNDYLNTELRFEQNTFLKKQYRDIVTAGLRRGELTFTESSDEESAEEAPSREQQNKVYNLCAKKDGRCR